MQIGFIVTCKLIFFCARAKKNLIVAIKESRPNIWSTAFTYVSFFGGKTEHLEGKMDYKGAF